MPIRGNETLRNPHSDDEKDVEDLRSTYLEQSLGVGVVLINFVTTPATAADDLKVHRKIVKLLGGCIHATSPSFSRHLLEIVILLTIDSIGKRNKVEFVLRGLQ